MLCWLVAQTMFDILPLALVYAAIARCDLFSERFAGSLPVDKDRRNAPSPHLIVPARKERRGQSAKTPVLSQLFDN
ncbi:hypothetical protein NIES3974_18610 [Calothrix sp. NIES-3974]|nr:hypothetical protein NIES3974_18610 [Calothrix sp. NIES-3974]